MSTTLPRTPRPPRSSIRRGRQALTLRRPTAGSGSPRDPGDDRRAGARRRPVAPDVLYSLQKVSFNGPSTWVGLDNYARVSSSDFQHSLRITPVRAGFLVLSTGLGLGFALLLNEPFAGRARRGRC